MSRSRSFSRSPRQSIQARFGFFDASQQPPMPIHSSSNSTGNLLEVTLPPAELQRSMSSNHASLRGMRRLEARRQMEETNYLSSKARSQNLNPPVDLRLLDYVTPYDDNLMCPVCRCAFIDPVVLVECDHCFCRDCIRQTWATTASAYTPLGPRGDCPSCRTPAKLGPRSATSKILVNITDDLVVRCPNSEQGCKATVKRGEVQDHVGIYCGYAKQECHAEDCEQPVRRRDADLGCLHYDVTCLDCRETMQKAELEAHWKAKCPDREVACPQCQEAVLSRDLDKHSRETCPAVTVSCPGAVLGCASRSKRSQAKVHARTCTLAILAPVLQAQKQRLDEQEVIQRTMSRKLEVLESGFAAVQEILYAKHSVQAREDDVRADERRIPLLLENGDSPRRRHTRMESTEVEDMDEQFSGFEFPSPTSPRPISSRLIASLPPSRPAPPPPGPRPEDLPEPFSTDFDMPFPAAFPPPAAHGPYVSPLHHLLSMHEALRDELSRVSTAVQELDGRQSMHTLNENLRMREEMGYLGAQVTGLSRQVGWLTSTQLQRQQQQHGAGVGSSAGGGGMDGIAGAGAGVEAAVGAVGAAASALRGAAQVRAQARRGHSEEGRTKL
ncbi:hypothetical protein LTS10_000701 [Elasticomyces elasticus]|nr:hypothetical protein LTS10_000701 [Elasticomyces elasticus]